MIRRRYEGSSLHFWLESRRQAGDRRKRAKFWDELSEREAQDELEAAVLDALQARVAAQSIEGYADATSAEGAETYNQHLQSAASSLNRVAGEKRGMAVEARRYAEDLVQHQASRGIKLDTNLLDQLIAEYHAEATASLERGGK